MEDKIKGSQDTKKTLLDRAEGVLGNVKDKVEGKAEDLLKKAKESELAEKAKDKVEDLKEGTKKLWGKVTDKFTGGDNKKTVTPKKK
jgi:hypothetical protein